MVLLVVMGVYILWKYAFMVHDNHHLSLPERRFLQDIDDGDHRDGTVHRGFGFFTRQERRENSFLIFLWLGSIADCISYIWRAHSW